MKKLFSVMIVSALVCAGLAVVSGSAQAIDSLDEAMVYYSTGSVTLRDVEWHPSGRLAIGVGDNGEIWRFDTNETSDGKWTQVRNGPEQFKAITYDPGYNWFFIAGDCGSVGANIGQVWYLRDDNSVYGYCAPDLMSWNAQGMENYIIYDFQYISYGGMDYFVGVGQDNNGLAVLVHEDSYSGMWTSVYPDTGAVTGTYYGFDYDGGDICRVVGIAQGLSQAQSWFFGDTWSYSYGSGGPTTNVLYDIDYNPATADFLVAGDNAAYIYNEGDGGWFQLTGHKANDTFYGCAWNGNSKPTGTANEVAILVGKNTFANKAIVYQHNEGDTDVIDYELDASFSGHMYWGVECRPVGTPLGMCVGASGGGFGFVTDSGTDLIVNTFWPNIVSADFRQVAVVKENQMNEVNIMYNFRIEAYYDNATGGDSKWDQAVVDVYGWYDNGFTGVGGSNYSDAEGVNSQNTQFHLRYTGGAAYGVGGSWTLIYPTNAGDLDFEIAYGPAGASHATANVGGRDHHIMIVYFTFNEQVRNASGGGGMVGTANEFDKDTALNDDYTWDFEVRVSDVGDWWTGESIWNEFGVNRYTTLTASQNPTGNAPPNDQQVQLTDGSDRSQLMYSANCPHNVTVEINDLSGPGSLTADNIAVNNFDTVLDTESDCAVTVYFSGAGQPMEVWGNNSYMSPADRGRRTQGSTWGSYNGGDYTELDWFAQVPVGTAEGSYTSAITFTIGQSP